MGKGLALQFKRAYPHAFVAYRDACDQGRVRLGEVLPILQPPPAPIIILFPTKQNWWDKSRLGDVEAGLASLVQVVRELGVGSVAIPRLGCGLGGLQWVHVRALILRAFAEEGVRVLVVSPGPGQRSRV